MPFRGVKILVFLVFIVALFSSTNGAAAKTSKPMGTVGSKDASLRGVGEALCYCNWWGTCYYCPRAVYKCYMCQDGVHCCYDDTPVCCLSSGICCPSDSSCCGSECCSNDDICCSDTSSCCPSDTPNCCPNPELCCPEDKPVCCEDPNHCCEEDTTCCGEECCNSDQKCCTDNDNNKYCCGKDADCCGNQCCKDNTECCELLEMDGGSKNACLSYQKDEEQSPAHPEVLTNEVFQSLGGNGQLVILAVAVGQGDCTIIYCPNNNDIVIVDMGASRGGEYVTADDMKGYLAGYFQRYPNAKMHNLITHPNQDHYNYFETAVADIASCVSCFVLGGVQQSSQYGDFGTWLENSVFKDRIYVINNGYPCYGNVLCSIRPQSGIGQQLSPQFCGNDPDSPTFTIMAANQGSAPNSKSTVLRVEYGTWSALLPGDFDTKAAQINIVAHYSINPPGLESSCYKIAHHGAASNFANFPDFLEAINPEIAFVSQMYPSEFSCHHPRRETIEQLQIVMREGRAVERARSSVSPFAYWNKAEGKVQVNTRFCMPIYATCRQVGICNNIIIRSTGSGSASIRYANTGTFPKVVAADPVSTDTLDCEDYDDDAGEKYISKDVLEAEDGEPKERARYPANHQEL